jgi:GAF domain-containing protein
MSELQKLKYNIVSQLQGLCAHCATQSSRPHRCPVQEISARVESLRGVPLIVNNQFKGVLFARV